MSATLVHEKRQRARQDVETQKVCDIRRRAGWPCLLQRFNALLDAHQAVEEEEEGSSMALRHALIDMASVCETIAAELIPHRLR